MLFKSIIISFSICLIVVACSNEMDKANPAIEQTTKWFKDVHTDKASYSPGDTVIFKLSFRKHPIQDFHLIIRYSHLNNHIRMDTLAISNNQKVLWSWQPPAADFKGYLAEVSLNNNDILLDKINIAVDVSSDWKRFPRYGFLSHFGELNQSRIDSVMWRLNRHHINGIQFYDWHYKHHMPLSIKGNQVTETWQDIAKRTIHRTTIEKYLDACQKYNMKTMAYNLLYGSWEDGPQDGASKSWRLYHDSALKDAVKIDFDENWSSDIYWMNPGSQKWQDYIFSQTAKVFDMLSFDGWHIDQLGDWGTMWTADQSKMTVDTTFGSFLNSAKTALKRPLVMNAVTQYGQEQIARNPVEFLYSEVWDPDSTYSDLLRIIQQNDSLSGQRLKSVLAAYVNQGLAEKPGDANTASVLLADALIFASGASHLELGEHLLVHPYFPNNNLKMDAQLQKGITDYYDFLVAYQNIIRGDLLFSTIEIKPESGIQFSRKPEQGKVWHSAKTDKKLIMIQLVNFTSAKTMNWRDNKGIQTQPELIAPVFLSIDSTIPVKRIWCASADFGSGSPVAVPYKLEQNRLKMRLPGLKYWTMLVIEQQETN